MPCSGKNKNSISVKEGAAVTDTATVTISCTHAANATLTIAFIHYSDNHRNKHSSPTRRSSDLGELVPASNPETLAPGTYFWQASYSGDPSNEASKSQCSSEVETEIGRAHV